jgi:AcrR family transcriptional regulator
MSRKMSKEQEDLRVRRTHKLLWEALMAELSQRSFEEITVKEICERAMVHRSTFYHHYEDKYALLEQGIRQMYDVFLAEVNKPPSAFDVSDPPPYFVHLFEHVAQHQQFYKLMLCGEDIGRFQKLVKEYVAEVASAKLPACLSAHQKSAVPLAMHVQSLAGAVLSLLAWWLENNMPLSPSHMAQYLLSLHGSSSSHS